MKFIHSRGYEQWAIIIARVFLAFQFSVGAYFKIIGFSGEAAMTAAVGVPFANIAVALALALEVAGILSLLSGRMIHQMSLLLALYVALLAVLFYHGWSNPQVFGLFVSHLGLIAALLYVSVFGGRKA